MTPATDAYLPLAVQARGWASLAAHLAAGEFRRVSGERKQDGTDVTATDRGIQRAICERIRQSFPDHAILCEEDAPYLQAAPAVGQAAFCWVIDPLDGTRNYVRGMEIFSTSIGLLHEGEPVVGVVRHLISGATYWAARGHGAHASRGRIRVNDHPIDHNAVVTFQPASDGSTYDLADAWLRGVHTRNLGSTALHLALLADGCVDACVCEHNQLWDIAAGTVLVEEAGGILTGLRNEPLFPIELASAGRTPCSFVAGNPAAHATIVAQHCAAATRPQP
jgi:myo-inositol-1(or 4)-monophosphatase